MTEIILCYNNVNSEYRILQYLINVKNTIKMRKKRNNIVIRAYNLGVLYKTNLFSNSSDIMCRIY